MASTYSNLKFQLMATGENSGTWGNVTNDNLGIAVEQAITGSVDVTVSSDTTLSLTDTNAAQNARALRLNIGGSGGFNLTVPSIQKLYLVNNGTLGAVVVKNASGATVTVPTAKTMWVYSTGSAVVDAVTHLTSLTLGSALPVASGGTGITSLGSGVATWLGTPSSANLASAVTDETGTGALVFANTPTLVSPVLGTPTSGNLNNCTAEGTNPVGYRNIPNSGAKTTAYTLVATDVGKFIELGSGGSVVVPASIFAAGDANSIFNNTSGSISCNCSAVTTVYKGGTDADISTFSINTRGVATVLFITTTTAVVTGNLA